MTLPTFEVRARAQDVALEHVCWCLGRGYTVAQIRHAVGLPVYGSLSGTVQDYAAIWTAMRPAQLLAEAA